MPEPADQPPKPPRTWRPMAAGVAGILLTLGLVWFLGVVVIPLWGTKRIVGDCVSDKRPRSEAVKQLGGNQRAASRLRLYISLPASMAPNQLAAVDMLTGCGRPGTDALVSLMSHRDAKIRAMAASRFQITTIEGPERAARALGRLLFDEDEEVRDQAGGALFEMATRERALVQDTLPALIRCVESSEMVCNRQWAIEVLCKMGETAKPAIPALLEAAKRPDSDGYHSYYCYGCIALIDENEGRPFLAAMLNDEDAEKREYAARVLEKIREKGKRK
jgi:hypothetical protein